MITEDYVSYEVAKLLKEKGFNGYLKCTHAYTNLKKLICGIPQEDDFIYAPTHQMAMKWLREVHKLHVKICRSYDYGNEAWCKYMGKCSTEIITALEFALRWCDEHPHWISVEDYVTDELPPLMNEKDPYGESVHVLFVVELNGIQFIYKGNFDYDSGMWHALETDYSYCKENVTHWMPMPKPPKKGK